MKNLSKYVMFAIVAVVAVVALSSVVHAKNAPPKKSGGTEENFREKPSGIMQLIAFVVVGTFVFFLLQISLALLIM